MAETDKHFFDVLKENGVTCLDAGYMKFKFIYKKTLTVEGHDCWGYTDFHLGHIALSTTLENDAARLTCIHEMLHVLFELVGLGDREDKSELPSMTNEDLVQDTTRGLALLMTLNPKLFAILNVRPQEAPQN